MSSAWRDFVQQRVAPGAFVGTVGGAKPSVVMMDAGYIMQRLPKTIKTVGQCVQYFESICMQYLVQKETASHVRVLILVADTEPEEEKDTKKHPPLCMNSEMDLLPEPISDWCNNKKVVRRSIYAAVYNKLIRTFKPYPGKMLVLSGFPGRSEWVECTNMDWWYLAKSFHIRHEEDGGAMHTVEILREWHRLPLARATERADPLLYQRTYVIESVPPHGPFPNGETIIREWVDVSPCAIGPVHMRMLYLVHAFVEDRILLMCGNRHLEQLMCASLLHAYERLAYVAIDGIDMKHRGSLEIACPGGLFINVDELYKQTCVFRPFLEARVGNHELLLCLLQILMSLSSENDVWEIFSRHLIQFRNAVMLSKALPYQTRATERTICFDESILKTLLEMIGAGAKEDIKKIKRTLNYWKKTPLGIIVQEEEEEKEEEEKDNVYSQHLFDTFAANKIKKQKLQ